MIRHKVTLIDWVEELESEILSSDQTYKNFANNIKAELDEQKAFEVLRAKEKELNTEIKKTVDELK